MEKKEKVVKLTKKDKFNMLLELSQVQENDMLVEFIDNEIELLSRKSGSKSMTKEQKENVVYKEIILEILQDTDLESAMSISAIQNKNESLKDFSNQKMSALLKQLVDNKLVNKDTINKRAVFYIVK